MGSEVVLVCEDAEFVRRLVCRFLNASGYQTLEAENGAHALEVVEQHEGPIDLLVTDVIMPVMNGKELAQAMERTHPNMKVIYLSGYTADVVDQSTLEKPGRGFLHKPFTRQDLLSRVRSLLDGLD